MTIHFLSENIKLFKNIEHHKYVGDIRLIYTYFSFRRFPLVEVHAMQKKFNSHHNSFLYNKFTFTKNV